MTDYGLRRLERQGLVPGVTGRTGIWALATDGVIGSSELNPHLEYLVDLIFGHPASEDRLKELRELMARNGISADISCFWRGGPDANLPLVPENVTAAFRVLPAEIETDFEVEEPSARP